MANHRYMVCFLTGSGMSRTRTQINHSGGKELPQRRLSAPALTFEGPEDLAGQLEGNDDVVEVRDEGLV
ncbi:uncharacterized protein ACHE_40033S [Aspergillus chevalieri]|uniref:Uncharacterized protein n=1 Tax=Aspergillus chevalieri TaxID=182096 RepID=A0A7R7ZNA0_ASPCH|nr:uncharacterized protein ACHE_40033S [Aspergillus chevalieri]BCR87469.1 hypothetical protein ACHE_40033S [Aspergillus chevalieri]